MGKKLKGRVAMGLETYFRIFAVDNTGKNKYTKDQIESIWKEVLKHDVIAPFDDEDDANPHNVIPPFLIIREPPTKESKQYNCLPSQKHDPFPMWIDTATGNVAYEIMEVNFLSDFDELYKHYGLEGPSNCCDIPIDDISDMMSVLNYIQRGKYDADLEESVFEDNEFFKIFENQFFNFKMRFRRNRKIPAQQTIRVIIKDDRSKVETDEGYCEDTDDWELIEERRESERDERHQIDRLKTVLASFLYMKEPSYIENPKIKYKLGYFLSY